MRFVAGFLVTVVLARAVAAGADDPVSNQGAPVAQNLLLSSERPDQSPWDTTSYPVRVERSNVRPPAPAQESWLVEAAGNDESRHALVQKIPFDEGQDWTLSACLRRSGSRYAYIGDYADAKWHLVTVDLETGQVCHEQGAKGSTEQLGDGWLRVSCAYRRDAGARFIGFGCGPALGPVNATWPKFAARGESVTVAAPQVVEGGLVRDYASTSTATLTIAQDPAPPAGRAEERQVPPAAGQRLARMLSAAWLADLYPFARDPDISDEGYEASMMMALRCARMEPDRRSAWDLVLLLADQVEAGSPEPARVARREALAALTALDPSDDVVRLARIADAIDQLPTADARVRAYETMLAPQNRQALGAPAAARLGYQLASLESRIGNTELYARWLGDAVKTDPSYAVAAQAAAGFFRMRVDDPTADVELLSVAVEANPRDIATWSALISILLDGGAFEAAERAARLAIAVADAERRKETVYSLTGDLATALWGRGQREAAMRELQSRMDALTDDFRRIISMMDPSLTLERINREYPPLPSSLSIAMIGLAMNGGDARRVDELVDRAVRGTDAEIDRAKTRKDPPRALGALDVQKLTLLLLFGKDMRSIPGLLESAEKSGALGDEGKARFSAMLLWRQGRLDEAIAALQPLAGDDPLAGYALASALAESRKVPEAAQQFKSVAERCIGTSIGLLALDRLAETLKQPVLLTSQLSAAIGERAAALDKALSVHLRKSLDEAIDNPMRALTVQMRPSTTTVQAYEPFTFEVRLRNNTRLPLAIGADSPISGRMTLRAAAPKPGTEQLMELPVTPILIDRRLRLSPGEELSVTIDSDLTAIGLLLNVEPLDGHILDLALVSNPSQATAGLSPGFMGTVTACPPVQFAGISVTEAWIKDSLALLKGPGGPDAAIRLALLVHAAADPKRLPEAVRAGAKELWADIVAAWKAQPDQAQAWVIGVMPQDTPSMVPLLEAVRSSTSPDVLRSWCITRVTDPKDPMLDVCRRTGDKELTALADAVAWVAQRRAARAVEEMGIQAEKARTGGMAP